MLASTVLLIALLCAGVLIKVPYAEMSPGPTFNTLGKARGEQVLSFPTKDVSDNAFSGHLNMVTVRVTGSDYRLHLGQAVYGWLTHDNTVVPHDTLYPQNKSPQEVNEQNAAEFDQSLESAKVAALKELGKPVSSRVEVQSVIGDGPSEGRLHDGDVIKAVDGTAVHDPKDVADLVTKHEPGEKVDFTVVPADEAKAAEKKHKDPSGLPTTRVTVTTKKAEDGRAIVGIVPGTDHTFPFPVRIRLADVGGPSAGMMFALGIIDKLTPQDLTGGKFVAGTGTIDAQGEVGPIGGVSMKTIAARDKGARFFLTPRQNCAEAAADKPDGLTLVRVHTLDDALNALKALRTGHTDALPLCEAS
jgi:PDZ domain-containing protein